MAEATSSPELYRLAVMSSVDPTDTTLVPHTPVLDTHGMTASEESPSSQVGGIFVLAEYQRFSADGPSVARVFKDADISVVVWNLEPGQVTDTHSHLDSAHGMLVLSGRGEYLRGDEPGVPIQAGDCIAIPRLVSHTIRNTGSERLSYVAVTNQGPNGYARVFSA